MSELMVPWTEHVQMIRRVGHLEGAIEAHRIVRGEDRDIADRILYKLMDENRWFPLGLSDG
jgi:hypothetical protein